MTATQAETKTGGNKGMTLEQMKKRVTMFDDLKNDIVVPYRDVYVNPDLSFELGKGYQVTEIAPRFLLSTAERLRFGTKDTLEMYADPAERTMLASIFNHRLHKMREVGNKERCCMVRTFKQNPVVAKKKMTEKERYGRVFLSDRYARIDNSSIVDTILDIIPDDMEIISSYADQDTMMIKVATPELKGIEVFPGDCYRFGIMFRNNEIGEGSVAMHPFLYRVVCTNGMVVEHRVDSYSRPHLGSGLLPSYNLPLAGINLQQISAVKDGMVNTMTRLLADDGAFRTVVEHIQATVKLPAAINAEDLLKNAGKEYGLSMEERKLIQGHYQEAGDLTLHGLMQAVTRSAQDVDTYTRRTELETVGGKLAFVSPKNWDYLNRPVENKRGRIATQKEIDLAIAEAEYIVEAV